MTDIQWDRYPLVATLSTARTWLEIQANLGRAPNTVDAYGRDLEDYLRFCEQLSIAPQLASKEHIARYLRDLSERPRPHAAPKSGLASPQGLANATMQRRLTVVRLYYDYLIEEQIRMTHPVGRGRYTPGNGFALSSARGLLPRQQKLPWIPNEEQWQAVLCATREEPIRNRCMFAFAYDAALRREELCALSTDDIDPGHRLLRIRAETTKNHHERIVPYSVSSSILFATYLLQRRTLSRARGPVFLSESRRNQGQPVSIWTWSKVVEGIADRSDVPQFTTHTLRHLCLTDLAHAGWDIHDIAIFAGHRSTQTTLRYIHISGRSLAAKLERGMNTVHSWRTKMIEELLG